MLINKKKKNKDDELSILSSIKIFKWTFRLNLIIIYRLKDYLEIIFIDISSNEDEYLSGSIYYFGIMSFRAK
ncbi:unnamed protein product [Rhizophagus irregularis]|nr:unnamed protein product [Rhizophagus irregularis]